MSADPPDDDDYPPGYDPVLDAELDELAEGLNLKAGRRIPDDLLALKIAINDCAALRLGVPEAPPYQFDRFEVFSSKLGGMGMVLAARDPKLDRKVAIKLWITKGPDAEAKLMAEAKLLARLTHANVVTVYDTGKWQDRIYFVMEWVDGRDGHDWMAEREWPWWEVRDVFVGAGRGLAAAHDAKIQHRDFKPSNMLVGHDGRVLVADFGVADLLYGTPDAEPAGTPDYMAPERLRGGRGDARSDQFSFCVALWQGLHGVRPFAGRTHAELLAAIESDVIYGDLDDPAVPGWLSDVVMRGLEPNPDDRFADMHELVAALLDEPPAADQPDDAPEDDAPPRTDERVLHSPARPEQPSARRPFVRGVLLGAVTTAVLMTGFVFIALARDGAGQRHPKISALESSRATTAEDVIRLIEDWQFEEANRKWTEEQARRRLLDVPTHLDSIRIAEALLEQARILAQDGQVERALAVASISGDWARAAKTDLLRYGEPPQTADELSGKVREFVSTLRPTN